MLDALFRHHAFHDAGKHRYSRHLFDCDQRIWLTWSALCAQIIHDVSDAPNRCLNERVAERPAVDRNERLAAAGTEPMDGTRRKLLARTRWPLNSTLRFDGLMRLTPGFLIRPYEPPVIPIESEYYLLLCNEAGDRLQLPAGEAQTSRLEPCRPMSIEAGEHLP